MLEIKEELAEIKGLLHKVLHISDKPNELVYVSDISKMTGYSKTYVSQKWKKLKRESGYPFFLRANKICAYKDELRLFLKRKEE